MWACELIGSVCVNGVCVCCAKAMDGCVKSWCGLTILLVELGGFCSVNYCELWTGVCV